MTSGRKAACTRRFIQFKRVKKTTQSTHSSQVGRVRLKIYCAIGARNII